MYYEDHYRDCWAHQDEMGTALASLYQAARIGTGSHAQVFATLDGRALKITNDNGDRMGSLLAMATPTRGIAHVMGVWDMPNGCAAILSERLTRLSHNDRELWDYHRPCHGGARDGGGVLTDQQALAVKPRARWLIESNQVIEESLALVGIDYWHDNHGGNLMLRPSTGELVICDLGYTESGRDAPEATGTVPTSPPLSQPRGLVSSNDQTDVRKGPQGFQDPTTPGF